MSESNNSKATLVTQHLEEYTFKMFTYIQGGEITIAMIKKKKLTQRYLGDTNESENGRILLNLINQLYCRGSCGGF